MTPDQLPLIELPALPKLTAQQQLVLDKLREAGADGLHADEAGAFAHSIMESRWRHSEQERCQFCGARGLQILKRLRQLGLARYRGRMRVWQAVGTPEPELQPRGMLPDSEPLPF